MTKYKLVYFNVRGRGEFIRLILNYKGVAFENVEIAPADWPQLKASMPLGQVPVLYVDERAIAQTAAIGHYLGETLDLNGDRSAWTTSMCLTFAGCAEDLWIKMTPMIMAKMRDGNAEKEKTLFDEFAREQWPAYATNVQRLLVANGGDYLTGKQVTWCDFLVGEVHYGMSQKWPHLYDNFAPLCAHAERVMALPTVAKYLSTRKQYPM